MSSTLADLQRLNIKKMEDAEAPQDATQSATTLNSAEPSNEVSIIHSKHQSSDALSETAIKDSHEDVNEVLSEAIIIPSNTVSQQVEAQQAGKRQPSRSRPKKSSAPGLSLGASPSSIVSPSSRTSPSKPSSSNILAVNTSLPSKDGSVRKTLEVQIREHLIEQLMPQNGKGPVTRLNVEMPEDLHQQLKQHCVKTRTPIKGLINALIAWYLEAEEEA